MPKTKHYHSERNHQGFGVTPRLANSRSTLPTNRSAASRRALTAASSPIMKTKPRDPKSAAITAAPVPAVTPAAATLVATGPTFSRTRLMARRAADGFFGRRATNRGYPAAGDVGCGGYGERGPTTGSPGLLVHVRFDVAARLGLE